MKLKFNFKSKRKYVKLFLNKFKSAEYQPGIFCYCVQRSQRDLDSKLNTEHCLFKGEYADMYLEEN